MRRVHPALRWIFAIGLALVSGACAPPPAPAPTPVPPAQRPREQVPPPVPGPTRYHFENEPRVDVGLIWDVDTLRIDPVSAVPMVRQDSMRVEPIGRSAESIRIRTRGGRLLVQWGEFGRAEFGPGDTLLVGAAAPSASNEARLRWNDRTWRGTFKVFLNPRRQLTLATRLPLEAYLMGVVPGEIGFLPDSLIEAGRAQAIAARSYTLFYMGRRAAEGFDLYGTVEDQVYGPTESEQPLATRCVKETRAQVALAADRPIRANYCSTCGGITADVWEAWPADPLTYLTSRRDRGTGSDYCTLSTHYRWVERFTAAEFARNLDRFGPQHGVPMPRGGVGTLLDVRTIARSRSGRVWRLEVITSTGRIVVPAYEIRAVLRRARMPGSILRSNLFKVDVRRDPQTRRALEVVLTGAGSGHGVGLCQTGAKGMARVGVSAESILEHYYSGVEIRDVY